MFNNILILESDQAIQLFEYSSICIHMYFILGLAQHINFWFHFPVVIFLKNLMKTEKFA